MYEPFRLMFEQGIADGIMRPDLEMRETIHFLYLSLMIITNEVAVLRAMPEDFYYKSVDYMVRIIENRK